MKVLLCLFMMIPLTAMAQQRPHECAKPGTVVSSRDLGEVGEEQVSSLDRKGSIEIASSASFSGVARTKVSRSFEDNFCVAKSYTRLEKVCEEVSADVALGRGNALFGGFFNLQRTILERADAFAKNISFMTAQTASARLEMATQIITHLTKEAATKGIPRKWIDLIAVMNTGVNSSSLPYSVVEEIMVTHQAHNQKEMGFIPLTGATVRQGTGNGKLNAIFDLNLSTAARAQKIQNLIQGISATEASALSRSFIDFANRNGIPSNWDQFVLMMKSSVATGAISQNVFLKTTVELENNNRLNLGYQMSAEYCRMVEVTRVQNVLELRSRTVFVRESLKNFQINITNAPLLQNEVENYALTFDGVRPLTLKMNSAHNKYQIVSQLEDAGVTKINVLGTRLLIAPQNTLKADFTMAGDVPQVRLQNASFNPKAQGRVLVKVRYINGRLFGDKELGVEIYELKAGEVLVPKVALRNKEVDFLKISMQMVGSPYFSPEFSVEGKIK